MELRYQMNSRILLLALVGVIMVCSSYLMYIYDPLQIVIRKVLTLSPGSIFFNLWSAPPYDVIMKLYIFNVTNHAQFLRGEEKLNVTEIGPYVYKEILTNNNATFDDDGTMTFNPKRVVVFDLSRSVGDPYTQRIIVPNLPLLGIQASLNDASYFTNLGFSGLARLMGAKAFKNITVDEYLFGYNDRLVSVAHRFVPSWIDFGKFGILERLLSRDNNNTVTISVDPSKSRSNNSLLSESEKLAPYHIVSWNGSPGLSEWGYNDKKKHINNTREMLVEGAYEGTIFPPNMKPNKTIQLFRQAFCRPVPLKFYKDGFSPDGFRSYHYKMAEDMFDTPEDNPANQVYCPNGKCPLKGLGNIAPCYYGIPIVLSNPHFLRTDPRVQQNINGLKPNDTLHSGIAQIHPEMGVPIGGNMKIQINLDVGETKQNGITKPFNGLVVPLFWIELTMGELPSLVYILITLSCHVGPIAQEILMYLLGLIGVALISGSALLILFFSRPTINGSISLQSDYSPLPIIHIPVQYFKPEIRILK